MFFTLLADLNLAVWYDIAICTCTRKKILADFNLAVQRYTVKLPNLIPAKFSSYAVSVLSLSVLNGEILGSRVTKVHVPIS